MFYKVSHLNLETKNSIIRDSIDVSTEYKIDILDCSKSWARQRSDLTLDEIMMKLNDDSHFVFIERENYFTKKISGEVGFSTTKDPSYFLFIFMNIEELNKLKDKYNLKPFD